MSFAPAAPNGAPVEYYTVYANGTPHQCCQAAPCTITGLANGTTYDVYVTATNSVGAGPASPSATATPNAVPGQVAGLTATPEDTQGRAELAAGAGPRQPRNGLRRRDQPARRPAGQRCRTVGGTTTSTTFTGLTNGTTYTFRVMADNELGHGAMVRGSHRDPVREADDDGRADGHRCRRA